MPNKPSPSFLRKLESERQILADYRTRFGGVPASYIKQVANAGTADRLWADMRKALRTGTPIEEFSSYVPHLHRSSEPALADA